MFAVSSKSIYISTNMYVSICLSGSPSVTAVPMSSVAESDPGGSGFKSPGWIQIRIRNPDPGREIGLHNFSLIFTYF